MVLKGLDDYLRIWCALGGGYRSASTTHAFLPSTASALLEF